MKRLVVEMSMYMVNEIFEQEYGGDQGKDIIA